MVTSTIAWLQEGLLHLVNAAHKVAGWHSSHRHPARRVFSHWAVSCRVDRRTDFLRAVRLSHYRHFASKQKYDADWLSRAILLATLPKIFPLYFAFLFVAAICFASWHQDWAWLVTYTANFARLRDIDLATPFVHLWSLAAEEQFYLIWPFIVFFLTARALRRLVISVLVLAPVCRLVTYIVFYHEPSDWLGRTIYSLPTSQADAFAAGAMLVVFEITNARTWFMLLGAATGIAGAAVIAHQHLAYHSAIKGSLGYAMYLMQDNGFVWGYTLLNLTTAFGLACTIEKPVAVLESPPVTRLGTISYGIYVYHLPLLIALEATGIGRATLIPVYFAGTYIAAEFSFRYFETPFLRLKQRLFDPEVSRTG